MSATNSSSYFKRLERLVDVCRSLCKSADIDLLLQQVVIVACELTGSQYSFIFIKEQDTDYLMIVSGLPAHRQTLSHFHVPIEKSFAGLVYANSSPASLHNAQNDPLIFRDIEIALGYVTDSMLAVPLIFRGETIGVIQVVNKENLTQYDQQDITILDTLASLTAFAIQSMLLSEETQRASEDIRVLELMKSDFIAIASHELRTPLGLVLGHSTFLREQINDQNQREQVDIIIRNATRLKTIIEELSHFNGFQTGSARLHKGRVPMNALVQNICAQHLDAALKKNISLQFYPMTTDVQIEGDPEKLAIALTNLLSNALIFTDPNGHIQVILESLPGNVRITVADDGIGIPQGELSKIFDRFYQVQSHLTRQHGGLGLGLSVAKAMIGMHNGQIWAESNETKGTKFFILLPVNSSDK